MQDDESAISHTRLAYLPALDGVRAFAVVAVMLFHYGVPHVGGGFMGVDAFFVVRDVDRIHSELEAKGAVIITGPASHEFGMREFKVEDTNGYVLVFAQELGAEP